MKISKTFIGIFLIMWISFFLTIFKHHVEQKKHDESYSMLGLNISNHVDETIKLSRERNTKKGFQKYLISRSSYLGFKNTAANYKNLNKRLQNSMSQNQINEKMTKYGNTISSFKDYRNKKTSLLAIPFVIKNEYSKELYPDEFLIKQKGEIGIHKYSEIDHLKKEIEIKKPKVQTNIIGIKKYTTLPRLRENLTMNYAKLITKKKLKIKEVLVNKYPGKGSKKVFTGFTSNNDLKKLKVNSTVELKIKWLSKAELNDRAKRARLLKKKKQEEKELAIYKSKIKNKINNLKYISNKVKQGFISDAYEQNKIDDVDDVYALAKKAFEKAEEKNGIGSGKYVYPVSPPHVSGGVGFHLSAEGVYAIDFSPIGSYPGSHPIVAADSGIVHMASWDGPYGNCIIINHRNGFATRYAHMNAFTVSTGTYVHKGQQIGWIGTTGNSTGTHVHFEIKNGVNGSTVNPHNFGL